MRSPTYKVSGLTGTDKRGLPAERKPSRFDAAHIIATFRALIEHRAFTQYAPHPLLLTHTLKDDTRVPSACLLIPRVVTYDSLRPGGNIMDKGSEIEGFLSAMGLDEEPMGMYYTDKEPMRGVTPDQKILPTAEQEVKGEVNFGAVFANFSCVIGKIWLARKKTAAYFDREHYGCLGHCGEGYVD